MLFASKSSKVATLLKENPRNDMSSLLKDIPADPGSFEMVARFCHGYEVNISTENVIRIACLAQYLGMTEKHNSNNLLRQALHFFEHQVLPYWNKSITALKSAENILQQAVDLGLIDNCVESIIRMALENPFLLGEPFKNSTIWDSGGDGEGDNLLKPNVRRKLFSLDGKSEDLTVLSLILYEPIIQAMIQRQVPLEFICSSIYEYSKRWVLSSMIQGDDNGGSSICKRKDQREVIETVERLLPNGEKGLILPCSVLFEMLHSAIVLDSSMECRNGLEARIGKQLDRANVKDLLLPFQGYANEERYNAECIKRILKHFYHNYNAKDDGLGLIAVAELLDKFLAEVASDLNVRTNTFISISELAIAASSGIQQTSDFIYRAIDIYLDKHRYLSESEREEVCQVLDCSRMTAEACEHAAQNARLPLRIVVQVLFAAQLKLRDAIIPDEEGGGSQQMKLLKLDEEENQEGVVEKASTSTSTSTSNNNTNNCDEEVMRAEIERMNSKVLELEKECHTMRKELEEGGCGGGGCGGCGGGGGGGSSRRRRSEGKNEKINMWKEMKRKFGCISISGTSECNCQVKKKKVHPR